MTLGNKMKQYVVPVTYESWGKVIVEAKDKKELLEKLNNGDFIHEMSLPLEPEYIDDSYEIDFDSLDGFN